MAIARVISWGRQSASRIATRGYRSAANGFSSATARRLIGATARRRARRSLRLNRSAADVRTL